MLVLLLHQRNGHHLEHSSNSHRPFQCIVLLTHLSGTIILTFALSYGLVRIPKEAWEHRSIKILLNYRHFQVKAYHDKKKVALNNLETQYAVGTFSTDS